ncbi:MAG: hypothetical protein J0L84_07910, partial [Verrucomicrobia bacterium]|nr:hypothetical protein [Verrucomicrobiota bacterium]
MFVSLGLSPAIVPEAFLLPGASFRAVHVITTEETRVDFVQHWFEVNAPKCRLCVTRVGGFRDFSNEDDHFRFEEVLYRWILETNTRPEDRSVCIAGGFKTMSAAMQKAAAVLGAGNVFHVLADGLTGTDGKVRPPSTGQEIAAANSMGRLHWIQLGPESGWPQVRTLPAGSYPLETVRTEDCVRWVQAPDSAFRDRLRALVERSHRIAGAWDRLSGLPFADLATWSEAELAWLDSAVEPESGADRDWIARLSKVELHCHLGGFATHGPELMEVRAAASEPAHLPVLRACEPPEGWPRITLPEKPEKRLKSYMDLGDNNGSSLLRDPGCLRSQCEQLYSHFLRQNVVYAEVRCSPANYASKDRSAWTVLEEIRSAFENSMARARGSGGGYCHVNLLLIATRVGNL